MKIICIGRNYVEHIKELSNPLPDEPVIFLKPDTALLINNRPFFIPDFSHDIHYELELIYKVAKNGKHISDDFVAGYIGEIGLGIDFTARDLQQKCKEAGLPWEIAKSFDQSAVISSFFPAKELKNPSNIEFSLFLNETKVQHGFSSLMIFPIEKIITHVSRYITLRMGDIIFTGTPAGVGRVKQGDRITAFMEDKKMLDFGVK